jgi:hypothetical protein
MSDRRLPGMGVIVETPAAYARSVLILVLTLFPAHQAYAQADSARVNLSMCLSGKYPPLCRKNLLSPDELRQAGEAERRENLRTCMTGRYSALCKKEWLTPEQAREVDSRERQENLRTCLTGRYPTLCKQHLLTPIQKLEVQRAQNAENRKTCLSGRYPALCNREQLSDQERSLVPQAERAAAPPRSYATPASPAPARIRPARRARYASGCESGHWVESVSDNGEIVKLEDGTVWQVDAGDTVDSSLWLPTTDIVACDDKLINTDDDETVGATQLR